tara:strand:+ start:241 stop:651 length:411 start_codon:yes stop_codon:yes gene_type:complete
MKNNRKKFTIIILGISIISIGWITLDYKASEVPYISVEDLILHYKQYSQDKFRLGGKVHEGSIIYSKDRLTVKFIMDQGDYSIPVLHKSAAIPDLFGDNAEVIIEGGYTGDTLIADNLMTKCASRYEEENNYTPIQ